MLCEIDALEVGATSHFCQNCVTPRIAQAGNDCEPTERLAYVGPPLRRRTLSLCEQLLTKTKL